MKIEELLQRVVKEGASDGFIAADAAQLSRLMGRFTRLASTSSAMRRPATWFSPQ